MQRVGLVVALATFAMAGAVLYFAALSPFTTSSQATTVGGVSCSSYSNHFTVIASQSGYNGSIGHGAPKKIWPILCARAGEQITITVINEDNVEPHGFAVAGYLDAGITVFPGRSETISFYAGTPGEFRIYCNVICAVHVFMQSGLLVVSG